MSSIFQKIDNIGRSLYSAIYGEGLGAPAGINRKDREEVHRVAQETGFGQDLVDKSFSLENVRSRDGRESRNGLGLIDADEKNLIRLVRAHPCFNNEYTSDPCNSVFNIGGRFGEGKPVSSPGAYILRTSSCGGNVFKLTFMNRIGELCHQRFEPRDLDNLETIVKKEIIKQDPLFNRSCDKSEAEKLLRNKSCKELLRNEGELYILSRVDLFSEIKHHQIDLSLLKPENIALKIFELLSENIKEDKCPLTLEDVASLHDPYTLGMTTFDRITLLQALEREPMHPVTREPVSEEQIELIKYRWKIGSFINKFWDLKDLKGNARREALEGLSEWPRLIDDVIERLRAAKGEREIRKLLFKVKNKYPLFDFKELLDPKYFFRVEKVPELTNLKRIIDEIESEEGLN